MFSVPRGWNFSSGIRFEGGESAGREDNTGGGFFNTGVTAYAAPNRGLYEHTQRTGRHRQVPRALAAEHRASPRPTCTMEAWRRSKK